MTVSPRLKRLVVVLAVIAFLGVTHLGSDPNRAQSLPVDDGADTSKLTAPASLLVVQVLNPTSVMFFATSSSTAPRQLSATSKTRSVLLTWKQPSSFTLGKITDYQVQFRLRGRGSWTTFRDGVSTTPSATVAVIPGAMYEFRVAALNRLGAGSWSNVVTGRSK